MANKKFSEFVLKTSTSDVSHIVGYNGADNVQITPANFVTGGGTGVFLPLAGGTMVGNTTHNDNVKSIYGTLGDGLEIFHDGNDSYISDAGTGLLFIRASSALRIQAANGESMIDANENGAVNLYYDNSKKFETTSTGISVTGNGDFSGDVIVGSTSAASDKTLNILTGGTKSAVKLMEAGTVYGFSTLYDGATNKFHINRHSNSATGTPVLSLNRDDDNADFSGNVFLPDNKYATFGGANNAWELQIGVVGDNAFIEKTATSNGDLFIRNNGSGKGIIFENGSSERMRLDSSGNLGIGTSSPTEKLQINAGDLLINNSTISSLKSGGSLYLDLNTFGSYTGRNFRVLNNGTSLLNLTQTGNLGLGTSAPSELLEIQPVAGADAKLNILDSSGSQKALIGYDNGNGALINLYNEAGVKNVVVRGYGDSYFNGGNFGIGTTSPNEKLHVAGNIHAFDNGGVNAEIAASTAAGSTTVAIRSSGITHFNGGNVGIGLTAPSEKLSVSGGNIAIDNGSNYILGGATSGNSIIGRIKSTSGVYTVDGEGTRNIRLGSETNGEVARIDNTNGRVGIGTDAPTAKLQVVGLAEHADNSAATTAGLTAGAFYRTGDLLKVVH